MRRLLVFVSAVVFVDAMLFGALAPLMPGYAEAFGLSKSGAGLLVGSFGAGALLGGVPGGLVAARLGPKSAVVGGLFLLAASSVAFAVANGPWTLGAARAVQGVASTTTWAGALAWLAGAAPRGQRGAVIGTAFGAAVLGAILGPMFGAAAKTVGVAESFVVVGVVAAGLGILATRRAGAAPEHMEPGSVRRAFSDRGFVGGLWLNTLPAWLFGTIVVLVPLELDAGGFTPLAIGAVFLVAGLLESLVNPFLGQISDRHGRLFPIRIGLVASIVVAVAFGAARGPYPIAVLTICAAVSFGAFYTPGMALVSDRTEATGLSQAMGFGIMNTAWALGNMTGPAVAGAIADTAGDAVTYMLGAALCLLTLAGVALFDRDRGGHPARPYSGDRASGEHGNTQTIQGPGDTE